MEPRRLWRRYLIGIPVFIFGVVTDLGRRTPPRPEPKPPVEPMAMPAVPPPPPPRVVEVDAKPHVVRTVPVVRPPTQLPIPGTAHGQVYRDAT